MLPPLGDAAAAAGMLLMARWIDGTPVVSSEMGHTLEEGFESEMGGPSVDRCRLAQ